MHRKLTVPVTYEWNVEIGPHTKLEVKEGELMRVIDFTISRKFYKQKTYIVLD